MSGVCRLMHFCVVLCCMVLRCAALRCGVHCLYDIISCVEYCAVSYLSAPLLALPLKPATQWSSRLCVRGGDEEAEREGGF
jgi:hypothetical protein